MKLSGKDIIDLFYDGKLRDGDFYLWKTGNTTCNPRSVSMRVHGKGDTQTLTKSWYSDVDGKHIISNEWSIYKRDLNSNNFEKLR